MVCGCCSETEHKINVLLKRWKRWFVSVAKMISVQRGKKLRCRRGFAYLWHRRRCTRRPYIVQRTGKAGKRKTKLFCMLRIFIIIIIISIMLTLLGAACDRPTPRTDEAMMITIIIIVFRNIFVRPMVVTPIHLHNTSKARCLQFIFSFAFFKALAGRGWDDIFTGSI